MMKRLASGTGTLSSKNDAMVVWPSSSGLQKLPYEMMANIAMSLSIEEIFDLSLCCRHFQYLVTEDSFCKHIVRAKAQFSLEAQQAEREGGYARALRRLVKRRRAIAEARPYVVAIVGLADSHVFSSGKLCYVHEEDIAQKWLRILDLHNPSGQETVIDIPRLTEEAIPRSKNCQDYSFSVIHSAEGITSCLYSFTLPEPEDWLLIIDTENHELVGAILLESTIRLFVRNSGAYLYYGTHSEYGADGFRKWVLRFFDMTKRHLSRRKIHLSNLVGYEIGSTVCFEIIDGYLYGLSNQTAFEVEEIDWTSYYYCFRFRLDEPDPDKTQIMKKRDCWRRQHAEGPIDDRWGFLKLEKDETTGKLRIIESRKEWLTGQSGNRRSYYTTNVVFKDEGEGTADEESEDNTENNLPDDPLTMLLESSSNPNYMPPPERLPRSIHAGDDGTIYGLSKTHLRSYFYASETFLDLIDDPSPIAACTQRLRIRAGKKMAAQSLELPVASTSSSFRSFKGKEKVTEVQNRIIMWPEDPEDPEDGCSDPTLEKLSRIMNPKDHQGDVYTTNDERSIVYTTGGGTAGSLRALVWLSFDPAAKLTGPWRRSGGLVTSPEAHEELGCENGYAGARENASSNRYGKAVHSLDHDEAGGDAIKRVVAGVSGTYPQHAEALSESSTANTFVLAEGASDWARVEKAMYTYLPRQYV
ncbi:f-box domain containing protein [Apiospora arundinis]|uniref:F-box domain containing protein n=1 Tax=Apiospora arundinis TaxID=335852 RepID=A0ABR2J558_9PEZI